jgi:hypothetical protein
MRIKRKGNNKMKEVYVLYGRKRFHDGIFDHQGVYFGESPIVEVFDNFEDAKIKLKEYAIEAYNYLKEYGAGSIVDDSFIKETTEADLFNTYYLCSVEFYKSFNGKMPAANDKSVAWDRDGESCLSWDYLEHGDEVDWQMYCENIPWDVDRPILPGLRIEKCVVNEGKHEDI